MTAKQIFVNLPVKDLDKSIEFFKHMGYTFNPQFTDETATCMVIDENIFAMLITHKRFKDFTKKEIADAHKTTEVLICLSCDSKEQVDAMVSSAIGAGGKEHRETEDYGWMYNRSIEDLDGHVWEYAWMDMNKFPQG